LLRGTGIVSLEHEDEAEQVMCVRIFGRELDGLLERGLGGGEVLLL
jgi:hypothetical protein